MEGDKPMTPDEKLVEQNTLAREQCYVTDAIQELKKCRGKYIELKIKQLDKYTDHLDEKINELF